MSPSISLEQLATRSKITRKTQKYDYESYQAEYVDLYCRKQNHQSLPASNSTALMGGDTNDEFLKDLERLEQLDNDITAKKADMTLDVISGSTFDDILKCMAHIRETLKTDPRDQSKVIYPIDVVLIVILLARLAGGTTAHSVALYYKENYLVLQGLLPDIPSPTHMLSATTVNTVMRMFSEDEIQSLLTTYFSSPSAELSEMIQCNEQRDRPDGLKDTLGFDGQEMRSSFARGESSRRKKGANGVTVYNCTTKVAMSSCAVSKKNQEGNAFLKMLPNLSVHDTVIMSDALNSTEAVSKAITLHRADFLLPIKQNAGNKELVGHVEAIFNREQAKTNKDWIVREYTEKGHGRVESMLVEILPSSKLDPRIKNPHNNVRSIVRYTKTCEFIVNGSVTHITKNVRFYITSLEFSEASATQAMYSILDYWGIESHHGILDNPNVFNQDAIQGCNSAFLRNTLGINKIVLNVLRSVRSFVAMSEGRKTPMSFAATQAMLSRKSVAQQLWYLVRYVNSSVMEQKPKV